MAIPSVAATQGVWGAEPLISKEAAHCRKPQRCLFLTLMDYEGVWLLPVFHSEGRSPLAPLSLCSLP